ncbi:MAG: YjjG family noncanonical pyrimidine nucleotidase [Oscillospiraceae bacterium]|nr:YjjG family noncanonical pyrimidine nucleotidase [Oscillospiraceae bacterium]
MFEILFIDLDDTILDFKAQEDAAIVKTLQNAGITPTQEICDRYSQINKEHWARLEKGEIDRLQVQYGRFQTLFDEFGFAGDYKTVALSYGENLSEGHYFLPGAEEALARLSRKYRLFITSNGTTRIQNKRLDSAGIRKYFEAIFISQDIGINKPDKGFFDYCFSHVPGFDPTKAMIVGDSPSSDITGGQNAGIATCWINPKGREYTRPNKPDYEIESLVQLEGLLESL